MFRRISDECCQDLNLVCLADPEAFFNTTIDTLERMKIENQISANRTFPNSIKEFMDIEVAVFKKGFQDARNRKRFCTVVF